MKKYAAFKSGQRSFKILCHLGWLNMLIAGLICHSVLKLLRRSATTGSCGFGFVEIFYLVISHLKIHRQCVSDLRMQR